MTNEQLEAELKHLATKEDLAVLSAEIQAALRTQFYWIIAIQIALLSIAIGPIYLMLNQLLSIGEQITLNAQRAHHSQ